MFAAIALLVSASGFAIDHNYQDTPGGFHEVINDDAGVDGTSNTVYRNAANWEVNTTVAEFEGHNDQVMIGWWQRHVIAPHNEPATLWRIDGKLAADSDDYPEGAGYAVKFSNIYSHNGHFDKVAARLLFDVTSTLSYDSITKYNCVIVGQHTDDFDAYINLDTTLTGKDEVPRNDSRTLGNVLMSLDVFSGRYNLTVLASGLNRTQIQRCGIFVGGRGQIGQPIVDLGNGSQWTDIQQNATLRVVDQGQIPQQYVNAAIRGQLYINVATQRYPQGEIRGQLTMFRPSAIVE